MPIFEAVIECPVEIEPPPWPIAQKVWPEFLRVDGNLADAEVGLFVALLSGFHIQTLPFSIPELFQKIIAAEDLIVSGGIRVTDLQTGKTISPSCCCGLETWWEWIHFFQGGPGPWMGHDPFPGVERHATGFRVWSGKLDTPDGFQHPDEPEPTDEFSIEITPSGFAQNLQQVHQDLKQFLGRVENWAFRLDELSTPLLVRKIDREFGITNPQTKWQVADH